MTETIREQIEGNMAYSNFTLPEAIQKFGLRVDTTRNLFATVAPIAVSAAIRTTLEQSQPLASLMATEKGRTELLIAPLFLEVWQRTRHTISVFSGAEFNVDEADGLMGNCDFLLARGPQLPFVSTPVLVVVEAKRDDFTAGFGQCVAEMVAALRFNRRAITDIAAVAGAVTNGFTWKFMQLQDRDLGIDIAEYSIHDPDRILGILLHLVGATPT